MRRVREAKPRPLGGSSGGPRPRAQACTPLVSSLGLSGTPSARTPGLRMAAIAYESSKPVRNALQHAPSGSAVTVEAEASAAWPLGQVPGGGPGPGFPARGTPEALRALLLAAPRGNGAGTGHRPEDRRGARGGGLRPQPGRGRSRHGGGASLCRALDRHSGEPPREGPGSSSWTTSPISASASGAS